MSGHTSWRKIRGKKSRLSELKWLRERLAHTINTPEDELALLEGDPGGVGPFLMLTFEQARSLYDTLESFRVMVQSDPLIGAPEAEPPMSSQEIAIHIAHCCQQHGCKYGEGLTCPVEKGEHTQTHPCEFCEYDISKEAE